MRLFPQLIMIGFDRPLQPRWINESLLLAEPRQKLSELNQPFDEIARSYGAMQFLRLKGVEFTLEILAYFKETDNKLRWDAVLEKAKVTFSVYFQNGGYPNHVPTQY